MNILSRRSILSALGLAALCATSGSAVARLMGQPSVASAQFGSSKWASDGTRKSVNAGLKAFFGDTQGKYIDLRSDSSDAGFRTSVYNQFVSVFEGVPGPEITLSDGNRILVASAPDDASQLAIVVTSGTSNLIVATALLHNFCGKFNDGSYRGVGANCEREPTLTIFYSGRSAANQVLNRQLIDWTRDYLRSRNKGVYAKVGPRQFRPQVRLLTPSAS